VRNLIRADSPGREHRRVGQAVELIKTLKGAFAPSAESVVRRGESTPRIAQNRRPREDKAQERIGPGSGDPGFDGRDARKRRSPGQKRFVDRSGPSYPSLGGAAPIHENGWPAGLNPRSRSSKTNRPEPADNDGGSATTVANTENVAGGARLNGTWERGHGSGEHPHGWIKAAKGSQQEPQERCRASPHDDVEWRTSGDERAELGQAATMPGGGPVTEHDDSNIEETVHE
jgi:hypothetical protein